MSQVRIVLVDQLILLCLILYYNSHYVCLLMFANCRPQLLLDRLGTCLQLFSSTDSTSCHEFASQVGLASRIREKHPKPQRNRVARVSVYLNEAATGH